MMTYQGFRHILHQYKSGSLSLEEMVHIADELLTSNPEWINEKSAMSILVTLSEITWYKENAPERVKYLLADIDKAIADL